MMTFYIVMSGIALFAGIITAMDWLAGRQRRKAHKG